MNHIPKLAILPKFEGNFFDHLSDTQILSFHKFGGSILKNYEQLCHVADILKKDSSTRGAVFSVPAGVSSTLRSVADNPTSLQVFSTKVQKKLESVYKVYQKFARPSGIDLFFAWQDAINTLKDCIACTNFEDPQEYWELQCFILSAFGESFFVPEVVCPILKKQGLDIEFLDARKMIFLQDNFPKLSEDLFSFVDIKEEKTLETIGYFFSRTEKIVIMQGFVAKNGLLGWNGSDTTLSLLARAYYQQAKKIPRVIFWKGTPLYTTSSEGINLSVSLDGTTKYRYLENTQKKATQPFIHPQAIRLLDEPYSIPFGVRLPNDENYHLMVTSCSQQMEYLRRKGGTFEASSKEGVENMVSD